MKHYEQLVRKSQKRQSLLIGIAIIWLGFGLRLHNLAGDSFWIDEIITIRTVQGGAEAILNVRDHPPLLYALTRPAVDLFGETEFASRLPSLIAGILALPLLILLGKISQLPRAGLWAAFLLALSPFHVGLSQTARHYSLLTTFTLATYVILYLALKRPRWSIWLAYAGLTALNLYTHYGAFIVLASQALLILIWLSLRLFKKNGRLPVFLYVGAAALTVFLLFLPLLPRILRTFRANIGESVVTGTGTSTSLLIWVRNAIYAFAPFGGVSPFLVFGLATIGLCLLIWRRKWYSLLTLISATVVSFAMVSIFQVARGAFPRYISFTLPFYLFAAGIAISAILAISRRFIGSVGSLILSASLAILIMLVAWPALEREYDFVLEDWRSILTYLEQNADEADVLVALSLNYRNQFNLVDASFPYYLSKDGREHIFLSGNSLDAQELTLLNEFENDVWGIVFDWNEPSTLYDSSLAIEPFQTALFVVGIKEQAGTSLERTLDLYDQMIPLASELSQQCLMRLDKASLSIAHEDWSAVVGELYFVEESCPELADTARFRELYRSMLSGQLAEQRQLGQLDAARQTAKYLLKTDRKDRYALEVLTAIDLMDLDAAEITISDAVAPEPVRIERFTMPHNNDWGEVLLVHPPASVTYSLTLPDEAVIFESRIALAPESWSWGGDGATFIIQIQTDDNDPFELFRQHIGNSLQEQAWHEVEISLAEYEGETIMLTLMTLTGPAGDGTGDWAGWETPRLMWDLANEGIE